MSKETQDDRSYEGRYTMDAKIDFCQMCGKKLPPETEFCPMCGSNMKSPADRGQPAMTKTPGQTRLAATLIIVYSLPLLLFCVMVHAAAEEFAAIIFDDPELVEMLIGEFPYITEADLVSMFETMAIFGMLAGAVGMFAAALALIRKVWVITMALCMASALMAALTIIGPILGLVAFWMLYKSKQSFTS